MAEEFKLYCVVDKKPIPMERIVQRSITCCDTCQDQLRKVRLAIINTRKCMVCFKPSTAEERQLFRRFKAWAIENGHLVQGKRGRKRKKAVDGVQPIA